MNSYLKLLAADDNDEMENQYGIGWSSNHTSGGISKFKSITPPSLPISQPPLSPSFFCIPPGLSPTVLLDSPVLFPTNIFPSPTTGSFSAQSINWSGNSSSYQHGIKEEETSYSDFSFQPIKMPSIAAPSLFQSSSAFSTMEEAMEGQQSPWKYHEPTDIMQFSASKNSTDDYYIAPTQPISSSNIPTIRPKVESHSGQLPDFKNPSQVPHYLREQRRSDDGYNWRKYGQKQVKASENPRSYYKCTYPNCPTKKKVERSLLDGRITKIEYNGTHNHPKPHYSRKTSTSSQAIQAPNALQVSDHLLVGCSASQTDSVGTSNNSSISLGDGDFSQNSEGCKLEEEYDEDEPDVKRWKKESESEIISAFGNRTLKEPKVVVQTTSDVDILDDGYRWRKYGQKVVKGNTNPRNYYKCTFPGCTVRKHVERAPQDLRDVITTYEGKHNHDLPTARGRGSRTIDSPFADNVDKNSHSDNDDNIYIPDFRWM